MLPKEPAPVRLMSTLWADADGLHDELRVAADLDEWLDAVRIDRGGAPATARDLSTARALREALRRLSAHVTGDERGGLGSAPIGLEEAIERVNVAASRRVRSVLSLRHGRLRLATRRDGSPAVAGLAEVAEQPIGLLAGEGAAGLRACHAPGCILYFVRPHPRREWCSVACGNRARAARHYLRVRARM